MTDSIQGLIDIILEQQETITLLVEANKLGQRFDDNVYLEMIKRSERSR